MSLFGTKEKKEIEQLKKEAELLKQQIAELQALLSPEQNQIIDINFQLSLLQKHKSEAEDLVAKAATELTTLYNTIEQKKSQIIQLDDEILYQEFALYRPIYNFASSDIYKERLNKIRQQQKDMIKSKTAATCSINWTVEGSAAKGRKMTNDNIKQVLRTFNTECENAIDKVKFNNVDSMKSRIIKSFESLNKLNETNRLIIQTSYLNLKLDELNLAIEYAMKKQEEKEEQQRLREEAREEAKLKKEIEEARKNIIKEQTHYGNALHQIEEKLNAASPEQLEDLENKKAELLSRLDSLDLAMKDVDYRANAPKAGYVYIISNIGAFGEGIYKIGMTRRLEPLERVNELGDASVPFIFDVHAMIFSEDAPKLEAALHQAFESKKVNAVNSRKEFFRVSLEEIKKVVKDNYDKTVEFTDTPVAEHYRETLRYYSTSQQEHIVPQ